MHIPLRMLNVYGYGYCDDFAATFANLCIEAGYPARVLGLSGHVVAEVYYDSEWHLFDPTAGRYLTNANGKVMSYRSIIKGDNVAELYPDFPWTLFRQAFASTHDNAYDDGYLCGDWGETVAFKLLPGETITLAFRKKHFHFNTFLTRELRSTIMFEGHGVHWARYTEGHRHSSDHRIVAVRARENGRADLQGLILDSEAGIRPLRKRSGRTETVWEALLPVGAGIPVYEYEIRVTGDDGITSSEPPSMSVETDFIFAPNAIWRRGDNVFKFTTIGPVTFDQTTLVLTFTWNEK